MAPVNRGLENELRQAKYAQVEFERRWRVDGSSRPAIEGASVTLIEDRYIEGTRLRLRRMSRPGASDVKWKLTKKYTCGDPSARPVVTSYLTEAEYIVLRALPARELVKRRYHLPLGGLFWSLDLFEGALQGLELVECEADDAAALAALTPPGWAAHEVTYDSRYQGGALVADGIPED